MYIKTIPIIYSFINKESVETFTIKVTYIHKVCLPVSA